MENIISKNNLNYFIKSSFIKVYPSAFRGTDDSLHQIDPEACLNTEKNLTFSTIDPKIISGYVDSRGPNDIEPIFCIQGYRFSLKGMSLADLMTQFNTLEPKKEIYTDICLVKRTIDANTKSPILKNQYNGETSLDIKIDNEYYFTGFSFYACDKGTQPSIVPVPDEKHFFNRVFKLVSDSYLGETLDLDNKILVPPIRSGSGKFATQIGYGLSATGENQVIIGKYNIENHNNAFAIGNGTENSKRHNVFEIDQDGKITIAKKASSESEDNAAKISIKPISTPLNPVGTVSIAGIEFTKTGESSSVDDLIHIDNYSKNKADNAPIEADYMGMLATNNNFVLGKDNNYDKNSGSVISENTSIIGKNNNINKETKNTLVIGENLKSGSSTDSVIVGKFNTPDEDAAITVGNGTADDTRKNTFILKKDGSLELDNITINGTNELNSAIDVKNGDINVEAGGLYVSSNISADSGNIHAQTLSCDDELECGSIFADGNISGKKIISRSDISCTDKIDCANLEATEKIKGKNLELDSSTTGTISCGGKISGGSLTLNSKIPTAGNIEANTINLVNALSAKDGNFGSSLKVGSSSSPKFTVDGSGNVVAKGKLTVEGTMSFADMQVTDLSATNITNKPDFKKGLAVSSDDVFFVNKFTFTWEPTSWANIYSGELEKDFVGQYREPLSAIPGEYILKPLYRYNAGAMMLADLMYAKSISPENFADGLYYEKYLREVEPGIYEFTAGAHSIGEVPNDLRIDEIIKKEGTVVSITGSGLKSEVEISTNSITAKSSVSSKNGYFNTKLITNNMTATHIDCKVVEGKQNSGQIKSDSIYTNNLEVGEGGKGEGNTATIHAAAYFDLPISGHLDFSTGHPAGSNGNTYSVKVTDPLQYLPTEYWSASWRLPSGNSNIDLDKFSLATVTFLMAQNKTTRPHQCFTATRIAARGTQLVYTATYSGILFEFSVVPLGPDYNDKVALRVKRSNDGGSQWINLIGDKSWDIWLIVAPLYN